MPSTVEESSDFLTVSPCAMWRMSQQQFAARLGCCRVQRMLGPTSLTPGLPSGGAGEDARKICGVDPSLIGHFFI